MSQIEDIESDVTDGQIYEITLVRDLRVDRCAQVFQDVDRQFGVRTAVGSDENGRDLEEFFFGQCAGQRVA